MDEPENHTTNICYTPPAAPLFSEAAIPRDWAWSGFKGALSGTAAIHVLVTVMIGIFAGPDRLLNLGLWLVLWPFTTLVGLVVTMTYGVVVYHLWLRGMPLAAWRFVLAGAGPGLILAAFQFLPGTGFSFLGLILAVYGAVVAAMALVFLRRAQAQDARH